MNNRVVCPTLLPSGSDWCGAGCRRVELAAARVEALGRGRPLLRRRSPLRLGAGVPRRREPLLPMARAHRAARGSLRTELAGGQGFASRGQARELTGGVGRCSLWPGGGAPGSGHGGQQAKFGGCCKCMVHVFGMFLKNVCKCFMRMLQK
jgi:hypothetical protein